MKKDYELEISSRPYRIYWHKRFLRSYNNIEDYEKGIKFFKGFLINISYNIINENGDVK